MSDDPASQLKQLNAQFVRLLEAAPGPIGAFRRMMLETGKDGVLPVSSIKELIALAVAINEGCEDCILFHVSNAKMHGVAREELAEALAVCVEMGGGPASVRAGKALAAFDALAR